MQKIMQAIVMNICLILSLPVFAAEYYVSKSGSDADPGTKTRPWKTIEKANATLRAGDTVYIRAGEYKEVIQPSRSGTTGKYITYKNYPGETPVLTNSPGKTAIVLSSRSYVMIDGITVDGKGEYLNANINRWASLENAHYNVFQNNDFKNATGYYCLEVTNSSYNKILNNRIDRCGTWDKTKYNREPGNAGDSIGIHCGKRNLVQGNKLSRGGHNLLNVHSDYNVIRDNVFDNKWGPNKGYRSMIVGTSARMCKTAIGYNLIENNVFKNTLPGSNTTKAPQMALKLDGTRQIFRENYVFNNISAAIRSDLRPPDSNGMSRNKIYNNVFYKNGSLLTFWGYGRVAPLGTDNNIFKNNIISENKDNRLISMDILESSKNDGNNPLNNNVFTHNVFDTQSGSINVNFEGVGSRSLNWYEANHPSNFSNNLITKPEFISNNPTQPEDFQLQPNSKLIDAGDFLTETTSAGSGKKVLVQDAGYFSDGFGIVVGDLVQIGRNAPVRILKVDYKSNVITLERPISWNNNDGVSLPFNGTAPDIGAFELQMKGMVAPKAPTAIMITSDQ